MYAARRTRRHAFTLVEMLLVLVIIVILASIAVPSYLKYEASAQKNAAIAQINTFKTALQMFATTCNNGEYPTTAQGLDVLVHNPGDMPNWIKTLDVTSIPKDPWGSDYTYRCPSEDPNKDYDIISPGPDKQLGTADDITN